MAKVVRAADQERVRWRNDGGWTRDIARDSADEHGFTWRVSIADVEADGPFSFFAGFDRLLVLLDGVGMDLVSTDDGSRMTLRPDQPRARFVGELAITAELVDGPTVDFNVIWDRVRFSAAELDDWRGRTIGKHSGSVVIAHVLSGALTIDGDDVAGPGETILDESGTGLLLVGEAEAIVVVLQPILDANQVG